MKKMFLAAAVAIGGIVSAGLGLNLISSDAEAAQCRSQGDTTVCIAHFSRWRSWDGAGCYVIGYEFSSAGRTPVVACWY